MESARTTYAQSELVWASGFCHGKYVLNLDPIKKQKKV